MGLYQPNKASANKLTKDQMKSLKSSFGLPPFKVRQSTAINDKLDDMPLPNGFISIPIYNINDASENDDLDLSGCEYVDIIDGANFPADATYETVWYLVDYLREPMKKCFSLTDEATENMTFMDLYGMCDTIQSDDFEPVDLGCSFSE